MDQEILNQLLGAVLAIVLGVGVMVLYFWGTNTLLSWLLPDESSEGGTRANSTDEDGYAFSPADALVIVFGAVMLVAFYFMPWIQFDDRNDDVISLTGSELASVVLEVGDSENVTEGDATINVVETRLILDGEVSTYAFDRQRLNEVDATIDRTDGVTSLWPFIAMAAILSGIWGVIDRRRQRAVAMLHLHVGIFGAIYFLIFWFQMGRIDLNMFSIVQLGWYLGLIGVIGLCVQAAIPRPGIMDFTRATDLREAVRPWLFVGPALLILFLYLVYPAIQTVYLSFGDGDGNVEVTRPVYPEATDELALTLTAPITPERLAVVQEALAMSYPSLADIDLATVPDNMETVRDAVEYFLGQVEQVPTVDALNVDTAAAYTEEAYTALRDQLAEDYPLLSGYNVPTDVEEGFTNMGDAATHLLSVVDPTIDEEFVLFRNYNWAFSNDNFWIAVRNNILWLLVPVLSTIFGLLVAVLADGVRWGTVAKSLIFMPMAISMVGASVIWQFVYDQRPEIGLLNAMVTFFGFEAQNWLVIKPWNNFFLLIILVWIQTGFAMVLLSAALRGVPEETLEAARIDGANEIQIFFSIMIPQIMGTILVVLTTITIVALKVFDIVLAMTNGQNETDVLANLMYDQAFVGFHSGRGSVVALMIMVAVVPVMIWNIRQFQQEESFR